MSEKKGLGRLLFLARFLSGLHNRLKNLSEAVNATRSAIRIFLRRGVLKRTVKLFCTKIACLGLVLSKLMQLKPITEGAWGASPPGSKGDFCDYAAKISILTPFNNNEQQD